MVRSKAKTGAHRILFSKFFFAFVGKLEQVKDFGCKYFAILFDDIDNEMQQSDKAQFKSFADAQSHLTNELYLYLNEPEHFYFCPTEYCVDMIKKPFNLYNSEYLTVIGQKLLPSVKVMWTGPKVISPVITIKHLKDVEMAIKRKPLIWDNLHANDYDLKRVFLGNSRFFLRFEPSIKIYSIHLVPYSTMYSFRYSDICIQV